MWFIKNLGVSGPSCLSRGVIVLKCMFVLVSRV